MAQWCLLMLAIFFLGALGVQERIDPIVFKNEIFKKCQEQEDVPDDAMEDLYFLKSVEGIKDYKCVMKCIDEGYGIYQEDETINKEMAEQAIKELFKHPDTQEQLINANTYCVDTVKRSSDPCDYTYDLGDCFIDRVNMGWKFPHRENTI